MKNFILPLLVVVFIALLNTSCEQKCYDCTKKCGTCTKGFVSVFGCEKDSLLSGFSVDSWEFYLESQGYTCTVTNTNDTEVCGLQEKKSLEDEGYKCVVQ